MSSRVSPLRDTAVAISASVRFDVSGPLARSPD